MGSECPVNVFALTGLRSLTSAKFSKSRQQSISALRSSDAARHPFLPMGEARPSLMPQSPNKC